MLEKAINQNYLGKILQRMLDFLFGVSNKSEKSVTSDEETSSTDKQQAQRKNNGQISY